MVEIIQDRSIQPHTYSIPLLGPELRKRERTASGIKRKASIGQSIVRVNIGGSVWRRQNAPSPRFQRPGHWRWACPWGRERLACGSGEAEASNPAKIREADLPGLEIESLPIPNAEYRGQHYDRGLCLTLATTSRRGFARTALAALAEATMTEKRNDD